MHITNFPLCVSSHSGGTITQRQHLYSTQFIITLYCYFLSGCHGNTAPSEKGRIQTIELSCPTVVDDNDVMIIIDVVDVNIVVVENKLTTD